MRERKGAAQATHLLIVAHDQPALFQELRRALAANPTVRVILDRRANYLAVSPERRRGDRQWRVAESLAKFPVAVVLLSAGARGARGRAAGPSSRRRSARTSRRST